MKKNTLVFVVALMMSLFFSNSTFAQTSGLTATQDVSLKVDGSALIAVVGTGGNIANPSISISLAGATEAGAEVITTATNQATRLRVSSLVEDGKARTITAKIAPPLTTTGTTLSLEFINPGDFDPIPENAGVSTGIQDMTNGDDLTMVDGIKTCWSGVADGNGYTLKYVFDKVEGAGVLTSTDIVVTFTITEQEVIIP